MRTQVKALLHLCGVHMPGGTGFCQCPDAQGAGKPCLACQQHIGSMDESLLNVKAEDRPAVPCRLVWAVGGLMHNQAVQRVC